LAYAIVVVALIVLIVMVRPTTPGLRALTGRSRSDSPDRVARMPPPGNASMGRQQVGLPYLVSGGDPPAVAKGGAEPGEQPTPQRTIMLWLAGAVIFVLLDVVAWANGYAFLGVLLVAVAVYVLSKALRAWFRNRWLVRARTWNTGHHHEFPEQPADR
jgi:hypothetical protein